MKQQRHNRTISPEVAQAIFRLDPAGPTGLKYRITYRNRVAGAPAGSWNVNSKAYYVWVAGYKLRCDEIARVLGQYGDPAVPPIVKHVGRSRVTGQPIYFAPKGSKAALSRMRPHQSEFIVAVLREVDRFVFAFDTGDKEAIGHHARQLSAWGETLNDVMDVLRNYYAAHPNCNLGPYLAEDPIVPRSTEPTATSHEVPTTILGFGGMGGSLDPAGE